MQWACLGFPPLLLVFMLALERIERVLTVEHHPAPNTRGGRVLTRAGRTAPVGAVSTHNPHRVRPIDMGRSVRRMRAVAFHPRSRPSRYGPRNRSVGARHH